MKTMETGLRTDMKTMETGLRNEMIELRGEMKGLSTELRSEMKELSTELRGEMQTIKTEIFEYFDLKTEQNMHDFRGIFSDRTSQHTDTLKNHDQRLGRVETHLGLVA